MSERELVCAWVRRRDPEAFRQLCEQYARIAYAAGLRVLGNGADAEDITQECFLRLARLQTEISGSFAAWVHRVAVNLSIDRIRSDAARRDRETRYVAETTETSEASWNDLREHVDAAIDALPEKQRRAVVGHFIEGRSQNDLALAEDISRASIHERIHRGLHTVRTDLRRRGVIVGAATFGGLLTEGMAEATTVPAPLMAKLGTLTVYAGAAQTGPPAVLGAIVSGKLLWSLLAVVVVVVAGAVYVQRPSKPAASAVVTTTEEAPARVSVEQSTDMPKSEAQPIAEPAAEVAEPVENGATVEGFVRDHETGRPLEGVGIACAVEDGSNQFSYSKDELNRTDAAGRYRITGLAPGRYKLLCTSEWKTQDPGDTRPYEVELRFAGNMFRRSIEIASERLVKGPDFDAIVGQTVSGRVVDADGRPAPEASVTLQAESVYLYLTSADDGSFKGGGFPVSDRLLAQVTKGAMADVIEKRNGVTHVRPADPDALTSGAMGPLTLPEGGLTDLVIEVRCGATVRGHLLDHRGLPIPGAHVMARAGQQPEWAGSRYGTTRDDGAFTLTGLAAGAYELGWNPRDENEPEDMYGWAPSQALIIEPTTVAWGEDRAGFVLRAAPPSAEAGLTITGRVTDSHGIPVAEADIEARPGFGSQRTHAKSGKDGAFEISGLNEGEYTVWVIHPQHARYVAPSVVAAAGNATLDVVLEDMPIVSGHVICADTGEPATRFSIGMSGGRTEPVMVEDPEGRFRIAGEFAGVNAILASADGYTTSETVVTLEPGRELKNVEVILQRGATVDGTVVTDTGEPVAGAQIFSQSVPQTAEQREAWAETRTDAEGRFHIENLAKSEGKVMAWHPNYPTSGAPYDTMSKELRIVMSTRTGTMSGRVTVEGEPAANARVELGPLSVFDALAYNDDQRTDGQGRFTFTRVPEGAYRLHTNSGDPTDARSARNLSREVEVVENLETTADLDFPAATSSLEGIVTYHGNAPPAGFVSARVTALQGREMFTAELDPDGRYALDAIPAGHAEITVSVVPNPPFTSVARKTVVEVPPETALHQDIAFDDRGMVKGVVTGAPADTQVIVKLLPGSLALTDLDLETLVELTLDSVANTVAANDGPFVFEAIPDGDYTVLAYVLASRELGAWGIGYCRVDQGSTMKVEVQLRWAELP